MQYVNDDISQIPVPIPRIRFHIIKEKYSGIKADQTPPNVTRNVEALKQGNLPMVSPKYASIFPIRNPRNKVPPIIPIYRLLKSQRSFIT